MKAIIQRVTSSQLFFEGQCVSKINMGLLILVGIGLNDGEDDVRFIADKICNLKLFEDEKGHLGTSIVEKKYDVMLVSNFTLYANTEKNKLSFLRAAKPQLAEELFNLLISTVKKEMNREIKSGIFGSYMNILLENDGPVTISLDSEIRKI